ncbi:MAG: tetratricopeptide repeat protein [Planctomycetota bacterium]|nr:tetratricopeptide repeat protein [Planctomycetota bacterium]
MDTRFVLPLLLALPLGTSVAAATAPIQAEEAAWPTLPDIGDTARMDQEVVSLVQARLDAVRKAMESGVASDAAAQNVVGLAFAELGLAFEANTMWTPAVSSYRHAGVLIQGEDRMRDPWLYRAGACLHAIGDAEAALTALKEVAPRLSGTAIVHARLGTACYDMGLLDEAAAAWQAAIQAEQVAWDKADPTQRAAAPIPIPASRVGLAQILFEQEDLAGAQALLREALTLQPNYPHAHYLLGQIYAEEGRDQEAMFELSRGLNAFPVLPPDPHGPRLSAYRAGYGNRMRFIEIDMQNGQMDKAIAGLEAMLEQRPNDHLVLNLAARAWLMKGDFAKSLTYLQRSETADPTNHQTKLELAILYLNFAGRAQTPELRASHLTAAKEKADGALRIAPHLGNPYYYRGLIEAQSIQQNDPQAGDIMQRALAYYQRAHAFGCKEPQLYEQMAMMYAQMGRTREMVTFAKQNTLTSPENPNAWMFMARACLTVGQGPEAILAAERAVAVSNNNPQVVDFAKQVRAAVEAAK